MTPVDFRWLSILFKLNHFLCPGPKPYSCSLSSCFCFHGLLLPVFGKELKRIILFIRRKSTIQQMLKSKNWKRNQLKRSRSLKRTATMNRSAFLLIWHCRLVKTGSSYMMSQRTAFKDPGLSLMAAAMKCGWKEENIPMNPVVAVLLWVSTKLETLIMEDLD